jgi:hypothetical protein
MKPRDGLSHPQFPLWRGAVPRGKNCRIDGGSIPPPRAGRAPHRLQRLEAPPFFLGTRHALNWAIG